MIRTTAFILCLFLAGSLNVAGAPPAAADLDFFEKKVRPVLVQRCYSCHSVQEGKSKGGLRLDSREGWLKGGDSGTAVIPGDATKSLLIRAIRYDTELQMPPKGKLPQGDIDTLVRWVERGAPDPRVAVAQAVQAKPVNPRSAQPHWAYQPIRNAPPPAVRDGAWPINDIDRFILAALESRNLRPAPDATRLTLVRRLYFDLIGLPPTPEQINDFLSDTSPSAYERLVDKLLASPHFGERWGRHWLDVARFGESLTLRGFVLPGSWRYRDYVIESFNQDRPFDQFMREQVAGDLLPADSPDQRRRQVVATAFLAIGNNNLEEQDKKQLRMDVVDEQLETIGRAFLAQTIGCARCHDHKFDPIPTADYYAMAGILRSTRTMEHANVSKWLTNPLPVDPQTEAAIQQHERAVAQLEAKIKAARDDLVKSDKGASPSTAVVAIKDLPGVVVDDSKARKVGDWKHSTSVKQYVGDGYVHDENTAKGAKTITFEPELPRPGKYELRLAYSTGPSRATNVPITIFSAEGETTLTINQRQPPPLAGHFVTLGQYTFEKNGQGFVIIANEGTDGHVIADAVQFLPLDDPKPQPQVASSTDRKNPTPSALQTPREALAKMEAQLKELTAKGPRRDTIISVHEEQPAEVGDTSVHVRGSVHTLKERVPRGFLSALPVTSPPQIPAKQSGRKELGQWLSDPQNPLPARVMANRARHWLFGQGLVRTTDNFGTTGETPSHPELLDYLARRFTQQGWSTKKLIREIVLSRTYRLSTTPAPVSSASAADPENRLLSRTNRRRLDAECIRDAILHASGQLNLNPGGPGYPTTLTSDFAHKHTDTRRSVYAPVFRNALPDLFAAFDFPDPSTPTGRRDTSVVAPQALFMTNNPFVIEQSRQAAARLLNQTPSTQQEQITRAYRLTLNRPPEPEESTAIANFLRTTPGDDREKWSQVFQALFASIDFRYVD
jgi:hypothetical protein